MHRSRSFFGGAREAARPRPARFVLVPLAAVVAVLALGGCPRSEPQPTSPEGSAPVPLVTGSCGGVDQPPCRHDCADFFPAEDLGDAGTRCTGE